MQWSVCQGCLGIHELGTPNSGCVVSMGGVFAFRSELFITSSRHIRVALLHDVLWDLCKGAIAAMFISNILYNHVAFFLRVL